MNSAGRFTGLARKALLAAFVAALWVPLLVTIAQRDRPDAAQENRRLMPLPRVPSNWASLRAFPAAFQDYFADHFGLRADLIRWYRLLLVAGLGTSPIPDVVLGRDDWLFLNARNEIQTLGGLVPLNEAQVSAWREAVEVQTAGLARQGIRFLAVFVPDSQSVYPEYIPGRYRLGPRTRMDQVLGALRAHPNLDVLDLRAVLRAGKPLGRLYHRTDTHWNDLGAALGARAILEHLAARVPGVAVPPQPAGPIRTIAGPGGDLARLLALQDDLIEERPVWLPAVPERTAPAPTGLGPEYGSGQWAPDAWENPAARLPRMVMFSKSFAWALKPFLAGHFQRALFVFLPNMDDTVIAQEHPRLVIRLVSERELIRSPDWLVPHQRRMRPARPAAPPLGPLEPDWD
jgi:hypothetical protein